MLQNHFYVSFAVLWRLDYSVWALRRKPGRGTYNFPLFGYKFASHNVMQKSGNALQHISVSIQFPCFSIPSMPLRRFENTYEFIFNDRAIFCWYESLFLNSLLIQWENFLFSSNLSWPFCGTYINRFTTTWDYIESCSGQHRIRTGFVGECLGGVEST